MMLLDNYPNIKAIIVMLICGALLVIGIFAAPVSWLIDWAIFFWKQP